MSNIVAIVGRPNVGKSTLYNRLTESRKAIVDDFSGVTRDRHYGLAEWVGRNFTIIDTGGYVANSDDVFEAAIREQVAIAIEEATVILFVVDVTTGITDLEIDYHWLQSWTIAFGANNLTDERPDSRLLISPTQMADSSNVVGAPLGISPYGINGGFYYTRISFNF